MASSMTILKLCCVRKMTTDTTVSDYLQQLDKRKIEKFVSNELRLTDKRLYKNIVSCNRKYVKNGPS